MLIKRWNYIFISCFLPYGALTFYPPFIMWHTASGITHLADAVVAFICLHLLLLKKRNCTKHVKLYVKGWWSPLIFILLWLLVCNYYIVTCKPNHHPYRHRVHSATVFLFVIVFYCVLIKLCILYIWMSGGAHGRCSNLILVVYFYIRQQLWDTSLLS